MRQIEPKHNTKRKRGGGGVLMQTDKRKVERVRVVVGTNDLNPLRVVLTDNIKV
jgi:hypothetical protein